ncbi:MAG: septal ring lytic transglycosylase RlpA family protein, partial [Acidobacteriia bacterium]|nr:septal ring lytic transglycosylase RlpA family protein [Terriglobia bacterium]
MLPRLGVKSGWQRLRGFAPPALIAGLLALSPGCLHRHRPPPVSRRPPPPTVPRTTPAPTPPAAPVTQGEVGIASWYGHPYHGRRTANGEIYNMYDMTAAHRTLPFNTQVRVHDLENGRNVLVRIN